MKNRNCAVIGNGALALSVAIQLTQKNCSVTYIDVSADLEIKKRYFEDPEITVIDCESYLVSLSKVTDTFESIPDAQVVVIAVTSSYYEMVFTHILPLIQNGQHILFMPACYGAILFKNALMKTRIENLIISEATSFPFVCDLLEEGLFIHSKKNTLTMAVSPVFELDSEIKFYNSLFDIFKPARNFLQTSLNNINLSLHPLPILLNISAIEASLSSFRHYIDGFSPTVGQLVEKMDAERISIGENLGVPLTPALSQLNEYYGRFSANTIREYVINPNGPYSDVKGFGLRSRYIMEDIPGLLVAAYNLASVFPINVPVIGLCINLASTIVNTDFYRSGFTLEKLGFAKLNKEEILKFVEH